MLLSYKFITLALGPGIQGSCACSTNIWMVRDVRVLILLTSLCLEGLGYNLEITNKSEWNTGPHCGGEANLELQRRIMASQWPLCYANSSFENKMRAIQEPRRVNKSIWSYRWCFSPFKHRPGDSGVIKVGKWPLYKDTHLNAQRMFCWMQIR